MRAAGALKQPRRSAGARLRLYFVRRMALRAMGGSRATRDGAARGRTPIRQPRSGAIPPADVAATRAPAPSAELLAQPITLCDSVHSPHARRIRILLREKSLAWQSVEVDMHRMAHKAPDYLAVNPNGELPALRHGARVIYDSQLIAEYLDRMYVGNPLYPDDAFALAQVRMWLALEAGTHKEFRPLFYLFIIRPELQAAGVTAAGLDGVVPQGVHPSHVEWLRDTLRSTPRFDTSQDLAREIIGKKLDVIEGKLGGRAYLVGDNCTMADIAWFTRIDLLPRLGGPLPPARYPKIRRWFEMISARPSIVES